MVKLYKDIDLILERKDLDLVGLGSFSYGTSELWTVMFNIIEYLVKKYGQVDIFFEDVQPAILNLNNLINQKAEISFKKKYNGEADFPFDKYLSHRSYDSIEFLSFIEKLIELNKNYDINIFGVDAPFKNNKIDLIQFDREVEVFYEKWPGFRADRSDFGKYVKRQIKANELDSDKFIAESITYLINKRGNIGLYLGHNQHIYPLNIGKFRSAGFILKEKFNDRFITIGTGSNQGTIKYDGEYTSKLKGVEAPMFTIYQEPQIYNFKDRGSLRSLVNREYKRQLNNKGMIIINPMNNNLSYFSTGYLKEREENDKNKKNYYQIDKFDFVIYLANTTASNNMIFRNVSNEAIVNYLDF